MAYSTPPNFTTGQIVTEAQLDILSDDISFLANPPKCRVYNSANISVPDSTAFTLTFNSERQDTDTMHSTAVNTGRITFTTAGFFMVGGSVAWAAGATGYREFNIVLNGATSISANRQTAVSAAANVYQLQATGYQFVVGDYIELQVFHTQGAALNILGAANYSPEFWAIWQSL